MCGRAYSPPFLFTWPNARISDGRGQAAGVLQTDFRLMARRREIADQLKAMRPRAA
jgi:hypothetical protein